MNKKTNSDKLFELLNSGKSNVTKSNGMNNFSQPFDFKISNTENEKTILFENINEAVNVISEFAGKENSEKIKQQILNDSKDNSIIEKSFILEFNFPE